MYPKVAFCSHHKCATKWFLRYFRFGCKRLGWKVGNVDNQSRRFEGDARSFCKSNKIDFLFYSNAVYRDVAELEIPVVHLVRDPRDILVSGYFSHRDSHETDNWPELVDYRKRLRACNETEGLSLELDFSEQFLRPMEGWPLDRGSVATFFYEDFSSHPFDTTLAMLQHLNLVADRGDCASPSLSSLNGALSYALERTRIAAASPIRRKRISAQEWLGEAYDIRFTRLKAKAVATGGPQGHYRKGGHGQWKSNLHGGILEAFEARYGHLVEHYGYANSHAEPQEVVKK